MDDKSADLFITIVFSEEKEQRKVFPAGEGKTIFRLYKENSSNFR